MDSAQKAAVVDLLTFTRADEYCKTCDGDLKARHGLMSNVIVTTKGPGNLTPLLSCRADHSYKGSGSLKDNLRAQIRLADATSLQSRAKS